MANKLPEDLKHLENKSILFSFHVGPDGFIASEPSAWLWTIYALVDARARRDIENDPVVPASVKESLLTAEEYYSVDFDGSWLFGSIPDLVHQTYSTTDTLGHLRFALSKDRLITCRRRPLQSLEHVRVGLEKRKTPLRQPLDFIDELISCLTASLYARIGEATLLLDSIEVRVVGDDWQGQRERLSDVRRRAVTLNRHIASINGAFKNVQNIRNQEIANDMKLLFHDISQRCVSLQHDVEQVQARARLLQDEIMARLSERSNNLLTIISVMTAVMLPATIVTGLFGMNTQGLPLSDNPNGFWIVGFVATLLAGLLYLLVRYLLKRI